MSQDTATPAQPHYQVPGAVHEATRSLLRLRTSGDARRVAEHLVRELGGWLVPAGDDDPGVLPVDVSFGDGEPLLAAAPPGSAARILLERHLAPFLLDARHVLQLSERNERLAESASTDLLTGLPNRRMLDRGPGQASADDTVILLDLDHFKRSTTISGTLLAMRCCACSAACSAAPSEARDTVGRFGGEEFLIVLASPEGADALLRRLRAEWLTRRPFPVTFSAGIAALGRRSRRDGEPGRPGPLPGQGSRPRPVDLGHCSPVRQLPAAARLSSRPTSRRRRRRPAGGGPAHA